MNNKWFVNIWQKIEDSIVNCNEPKIKQNCDRFCNLYWQIYDRRTNKFYTFGSELEVKAWLEKRYPSV